jgi:hypothetical protein
MQVCWHLLVKELEQFFLLILVMSASLTVHLASKVFELVTTRFFLRCLRLSSIFRTADSV